MSFSVAVFIIYQIIGSIRFAGCGAALRHISSFSWFSISL